MISTKPKIEHQDIINKMYGTKNRNYGHWCLFVVELPTIRYSGIIEPLATASELKKDRPYKLYRIEDFGDKKDLSFQYDPTPENKSFVIKCYSSNKLIGYLDDILPFMDFKNQKV